jgi:predicted RNA binding protein YcfA (HicA-like mRNA interferase family)
LPPLPVISGSACIAALAKLGYTTARQKGSHVRLSCPGRSPVTIPMHPTLDRGTLRSILRSCEISVEDFIKLIN